MTDNDNPVATTTETRRRWRRLSLVLSAVAVLAAATLAIRPAFSETLASCDEWAEGTSYQVGDTVTYQGGAYTARQAHTAHPGAGWNPADTPTLWTAGGDCDAPPTETPTDTPTETPTDDPPVDPPDVPVPAHALTGYWHNFVNGSTALRISDVPDEYDVIAVAFGESTANPGEVDFAIDPQLSDQLGGYTEAEFKADIAAKQAAGKAVIISVGGEKGTVSIADPTQAARFADSVHGLMTEYGFNGVDIDLEHGINSTYLAQALHDIAGRAGPGFVLTMAPQTIDMQNPGTEYFKLALAVQDILTVVNMQYYNSGTMLGCDGQVYAQGTVDFLTALACVQLENGLRADQVGLGLPASPSAAGGGYVDPSVVNDALDCLAKGVNCGSFQPAQTYPDIRGAMTWSVNWDVVAGRSFSGTVGPHLDTLP
ncbi:chitinase [Salininema proteolyticum]|uniref:chitinase n=1 Tax=Salininema proteolyticum TaxID=1607685 RepID=A0ABV8U091_9ACTN